MGHAASRPNNGCAGDGDGDGEVVLPSRFARFRRRLRHRLHRRRGNGDDSASAKALAAEDFAGIARIRIVKVRTLRAATPLLRSSTSLAPCFVPLRCGQWKRNPWI
jgi:hypothetical protein